MKRTLLPLMLILALAIRLHGQAIDPLYNEAFRELKGMLEDSIPVSFKKAVYLSENAYLNGQLNDEVFNGQIAFLVNLSQGVMEEHDLLYDGEDKEEVKKFASVFRVMKDTVSFFYNEELRVHYPLTYDFEDFWGEQSWEKMFVSKLLRTKTGNCHSLPFLYKIMAEELGVNARLAMAPNHTYVKHWSKENGWYNIELTNGSFPIDAWLMASGYIKLQAIQSGIYMDTLSSKQSIAVCLIDLAKGYERKYGNLDLEFILDCTELALKYYPSYANGLLLKAETLKNYVMMVTRTSGVSYPSQLFHIREMKERYGMMEETYAQIYQLGYRTMPREMYARWLVELETEKEKYANKKINLTR